MTCKNCGKGIYHGIELCFQCQKNPDSTKIGQVEQDEMLEGEMVETTGERSYDGSYLEKIHVYFGGSLFLAGVLLYSIPIVLRVFSGSSVVALAIHLVPAIGLLMSFAAAKHPNHPERTLAAIKVIRVGVIIGLVLMCIFWLSGLQAFVSLIGLGDGMLLAVPFVVMLASVSAIIAFYYIPFIRILNCIQYGVSCNEFKPLRGSIPFVVMSSLNIIFNIVSIFLPNNFAQFLSHQSNSSIVLDTVSISSINSTFTVISSTGVVVCLVVLWKFNKSIQKPSH